MKRIIIIIIIIILIIILWLLLFMWCALVDDTRVLASVGSYHLYKMALTGVVWVNSCATSHQHLYSKYKDDFDYAVDHNSHIVCAVIMTIGMQANTDLMLPTASATTQHVGEKSIIILLLAKHRDGVVMCFRVCCCVAVIGLCVVVAVGHIFTIELSRS